MNTIHSIKELRATIDLLELKQASEEILLREQFKDTIEALKPANLILPTFNGLASSPKVKESLLSTAIGLASGYLSKKILIGSTHNPVKYLLGALLQIGVTDVASRNGDEIKKIAGNLFKKLFRKKTPAA